MLQENLKMLVSGVLLIVFNLGIGIAQANAQIDKKLKIELGETFKNDLVKVYLNNKLVYENRISTPDSVTLTDLFYVKKPKKTFTILVEINGHKFEKSSPKKQKELDDENYSLLINYNRETEEVDIKTKTLIIIYD